MKLYQTLFFLLVVRPITAIVLGLNIRNQERLPMQGPAIIAANHNSHLDTLTLMSLWPVGRVHRVRPIAAADYFLKTAKLAWFSLNIMNIIPIDRERKDRTVDPLAAPLEALQREEILLLFPEGSRGEPEQRAEFKRGVAFLAKARPEVPVHPVYMHGLGKALPKGSFFLVPFNCDVMAGEALSWTGDAASFMEGLEARMNALAAEGHFQPWE